MNDAVFQTRRDPPTLQELFEQRPLACFCLAYLAGSSVWVLLAPSSGSMLSALRAAWLMAVFGAALAAVAASRERLPARTGAALLRVLRGATPLVLAALLGAAVSAVRLAVPDSDVSHQISAHFVQIEGTAASEREIAPFGSSMLVDCSQVIVSGEVHAVSGRVQLWKPERPGSGTSTETWPQPGQQVEIIGVLTPLPEGEPGEILHQQRVSAALKVGSGGSIRPLSPARISLPEVCIEARDWILHGVRPYLNPHNREALSGMLFHKKGLIDPAVLDDLQLTGTVHIVATAGLHVGIFVGLCLLVLRWFLPQRGAALLAMVMTAGYCAACGGHAAVFRATVLVELALLAWLLGRLPDAATCLAMIAAWMVFLNPLELLDAGFQFTFLTIAVVLLMLPLVVGPAPELESQGFISRGRRWIAHHLRAIVWLSAAAQLGSLPLTWYHFGLISWVGVPANLLVVPLLMAIIPLALVTGILGNLCPALASLPGALLDQTLHLLLHIARTLAALPFAWSYAPAIGWQWAAGYYVLVIAGLAWLRLRKAPVARG